VNLPHPFEDATDIKPNRQGWADLVDASGRSLARLTMGTAYDLCQGDMKKLFVGGRIECKDGFSISAHADSKSCCEPLTDEGPWTYVELSRPSCNEPMIEDYFIEAEGANHANFYPYVPIKILEELVMAHGGLTCICI
jgi:hypothetical protein